jgi:hypothetical protein
MKYSASFITSKQGNAAKEGTTLRIRVDGAHFISGGIYQNGSPVIAFQTEAGDNDVEVLLKRKDRSLKGKATLKVRAFDSTWRGAGWNDEFEII